MKKEPMRRGGYRIPVLMDRGNGGFFYALLLMGRSESRTAASSGTLRAALRVSCIVIFAAVAFACATRPPAPTRQHPGGTVLTLRAPGAASVSLAGTFNQWIAAKHRLGGPDADGDWTITLDLPAGRYEYLFLINGLEWMLDPAAPFADDGLGGRNSVLIVPAD